MSKHLAEKTIDLAQEAWVHRNTVIVGGGDEQEAERLLAFHDTLVSLARDFDESAAIKAAPKRKAAPKKRKTVVAKKIKAAMDQQGVTTDDVVATTGITASTFEGILSGETKRPQARTLRKIESALGLEEGDLERDA